MEIFDISPAISPDIAVWPGDEPYSRKIELNMESGHHLTLSSIKTTLHLGAHTDAPNHYVAGGKDMAQRSLHYYLGPAQVISVNTKAGERIQWQDLQNQEIKAPRIILRTNSFPDPNKFNEDFCSLSPDLINELSQRHVILCGIDTPSVDPFASKKLEAHNEIAKHNMAVLEGVVLNDVDDGEYELICLPLKLISADASPVRAILRR